MLVAWIEIMWEKGERMKGYSQIGDINFSYE